MSDLVVRGGEVLTPEGRVAADVVVRAGVIVQVAVRATAVDPAGPPGADQPSSAPGAGGGGTSAAARELLHRDPASSPHAHVPVLDARGLVVAPGFVDLQCNGAGGVDLTTSPERMWDVAALLPRWGVTAWLPTIVTSPEPVRDRALAALRGRDDLLDPAGGPVATPLGLHFEGPFLAPERRGVHVAAHLRLPEAHVTSSWARDAGVAVVTLAPELPGALALTRRLVDRGVVVSLGHSAATAAEATAAVDTGARWVTHLFNAMAPLHHRDPGLAGVALTDERLSVGVIADGLHLHPLVVRLAVQAVGPRLTLVSDAVAALGVPPGLVRLGDTEALADDEAVRLADGTLAGSILSLDRAVVALSRAAGVSLEEAVAAATVAPARVLGVDGDRGVVAPGAAGDLVLLDPSPSTGTSPVVATVIGGQVAYRDSAVSRAESP